MSQYTLSPIKKSDTYSYTELQLDYNYKLSLLSGQNSSFLDFLILLVLHKFLPIKILVKLMKTLAVKKVRYYKKYNSVQTKLKLLSVALMTCSFMSWRDNSFEITYKEELEKMYVENNVYGGPFEIDEKNRIKTELLHSLIGIPFEITRMLTTNIIISGAEVEEEFYKNQRFLIENIKK